jgi:hypothetical protein
MEDDTWGVPWGDRSERRSAAAPPAPAAPSAAGPSRAPGEPAPTVSVPYRVLHRPEAAGPGPFRPEPAVASRPPVPVPANGADDWGSDDGEEW